MKLFVKVLLFFETVQTCFTRKLKVKSLSNFNISYWQFQIKSFSVVIVKQK